MALDSIRLLFLGTDSPEAAALAAGLAQSDSFAPHMHWVEEVDESEVKEETQ